MADTPRQPQTSTNVGYNELGRTGLKHASGYLYEEFLLQLQGQRGVRVYTEMSENSPIIGAMLFAVEALLRSVDWMVEPAEDEEAAEFIETCMDDMSHSWADFVSEALTMLPFGWSYFEVVYKQRSKANSLYDDGKVGWAKFAPRSQDSLFHWEIDIYGDLLGMWQIPLYSNPLDPRPTVQFLPISKCLLFRTTSKKNSPEGRSILRTAYRPWHFAKRLEEIEAIGAERNLAGMPIAKVPMELLSTDRSADQTATYNYIKDIVTRTKQDEQMGIIWPLEYDEQKNELFKFELINAQGKQSFDTGSIIQRYQQQMAMTIMADFILLGHESVGSFALSSDKTELFSVALGAWLDAISDVLNRHAVKPLLELNGFDTTKGFPHIIHGDLETPNLAELGSFISALASAGVPLFPDLDLENHLRQIADFPPADPEEREKLIEQQTEMQMLALQPPPPGEEEPGEKKPPGKKPPKKPTVSSPPDDES